MLCPLHRVRKRTVGDREYFTPLVVRLGDVYVSRQVHSKRKGLTAIYQNGVVQIRDDGGRQSMLQ
jgi:hypothetical protein